jgi:UDP-GlcNAc:undecaprenyl-phosphate GlcNAc-1-phosphate transferase
MGFLPYNANPAKTFIGDVGAQFLGFSLSVIAILGVAKTVTLVVLIAPVLVLGLPIFDTIFAIVRRIVKGKSFKAVFTADKGHLHHRLMKKGYTQKQAVYILYAASATLGMFAIILIGDGFWKALSFGLLVIAIIALGYKQIKQFSKEMLRDNRKREKIYAEGERAIQKKQSKDDGNK